MKICQGEALSHQGAIIHENCCSSAQWQLLARFCIGKRGGGRSKNLGGGGSSNVLGIICSLTRIGFTGLPKTGEGMGALCFEMVLTRTFPWNQDATVKLKTELISIKF